MAGAMKFNLTCPRCGGKGKLQNACPTCHGDGRVARTETVEVRIPAGRAERLAAARAGQRQRRHAWARRRAISTSPRAWRSIRSSSATATTSRSTCRSRSPKPGLGAKIEVPTIDGRALLKIPPGTQNGQKFRLREKGVFNARKNQRGDQIVEVVMQAPKVQDERTKEILRELAKLHPEDPRAEIWAKV